VHALERATQDVARIAVVRLPVGVTTSQIIRATRTSPFGMSWKVVGSGIATMSDSSIALKPVMDEPSKPIPSSSAPSSSAGVIEKLFRWPSMSVNQRWMNFTLCSFTSRNTRSRSVGMLVALPFRSTVAIRFLL
jgi:hypothetical protein